MIIIESFINKIWGKSYLSKIEMKKLIKECLVQTNHKEKNIFLNVNFVDKNTMIKFNSIYRKKNSDTNVLSFENKNKFAVKNAIYLGDMILCYEKLKAEAEKFEKTFQERLYHLFVHSILHLLGYDHIKKEERLKMEKLEEKILQKFNIKNLYLIEG